MFEQLKEMVIYTSAGFLVITIFGIVTKFYLAL